MGLSLIHIFSVVTAEEMALHQPKSVKEALSYTPGVAVGTRGASNTYDYLIIRGFAADGQSQKMCIRDRYFTSLFSEL